ncbi:hypothetical protein APHAL10511_008108 [Amanita phalloides]|nr:hypothetical protein APHAL10511_008108 [Amanita phalloides]
MDLSILGPNHFLTLPTPTTATLAAHDFDVDTRTGFMPPHPPLPRLPPQWDPWESLLDAAQSTPLQLGSKPDLSPAEKHASKIWRRRLAEMPLLPTISMRGDEVLLRRAHLVLAWLLHFYVHSTPVPGPPEEGETRVIPRTLSVPLLRVCAILELPPVLTYADTVLYNWGIQPTPDSPSQSQSQSQSEPEFASLTRIPITTTTPLHSRTLFTSSPTEQEFYLLSARIELIGIRALELMRLTLDELFVGDDIALTRITRFLLELRTVVQAMTAELRTIRARGCDPDVFYRQVRPWLRGLDADKGRRWVFEGYNDDDDDDDEGKGETEEEEMSRPVELSGPSAGQSTMIHALDIFLGTDKGSHTVLPLVSSSSSPTATTERATHVSFLTRMRQYMPRHHRRFLSHLASSPWPLRVQVVALAEAGTNVEIVEAYNGAVRALKEFRDAHLAVVALYIVGPARRAQQEAREARTESLRGTGGTDVVRFLKQVRDDTAQSNVLTNY